MQDSPLKEDDDILHAFYAALVNFQIEIFVLFFDSNESMAQAMRSIVDACAESALLHRRILPRMWYERPFLLEEESQFERFLASTQIINYFAAQSLLHMISLDDLLTKRYHFVHTLNTLMMIVF